MSKIIYVLFAIFNIALCFEAHATVLEADKIRNIQSALHECGYLPMSQIDGFLGPTTRFSLYSFNNAYNIQNQRIVEINSQIMRKVCNTKGIVNNSPISKATQSSLSDWKLIESRKIKNQPNDISFLSPKASQTWMNVKSAQYQTDYAKVEWLQKAVYNSSSEPLIHEDIEFRSNMSTIDCKKLKYLASNKKQYALIFPKDKKPEHPTAIQIVYKKVCLKSAK